MAVAQTSIETYHDIRDDGTIGKRQAEVLAAVKPGRDYSLQELVKITGLPVNVISGRANELRHMGLLELADVRPCSITGRNVRPVKLPLVRAPTEQSELFPK